jgi:signal transduction histidine kinase
VGLPLVWRLLGVNSAAVLAGALVGTWLTQQLVLNGTFTVVTHVLLVLGAVCLAAGLSIVEKNALWNRLDTDAATIRQKTEEAERLTQQAERLAAQVILAQEDERRRVARELHDEAGQALTAVIIGLERGLASMPESYSPDLPVQPRQLISNLRDLAAQTLDEVRKLALELRPSVLDDLGLVAALRQYVRSTEERSGLAAQLTVVGWDDAERRLPAEVETALFRIAQEALTNALRHAHAASVQVRLRLAEDAVSLEVRDDGVGLGATPPPAVGEHLGMFGMRERARLLRGEFYANPVSPRGTLVQVTLPVGSA